MSTITITDGQGMATKDPSDVKTYVFDWSTYNLAATVTIVTSTWAITELRPVSAWASTTAYVVGNQILSAGLLYVCILANTDVEPPDTTYWTQVATDTPLTKDSESILAGDRTTQVRLSAGTVGHTYDIANTITTNEVPAQTKERSFRLLIEQM